MQNIRNFSIIAHVDHGKSTLADRMLEVTGTIEKRKMRDQVLDQMDLERERGITIKMQPVRMLYEHSGERYTLNLIDTPGHIDFSYEVSRSLKAVEGVILLVDATQGVQAQTLSVLAMAREQGCVIIPVLSKIDSPLARVEEVAEEIVATVQCAREEVLACSGKTGAGVRELLDEIIRRVPPPKAAAHAVEPRALVFDFSYSNHRGVIVYVRMFDGALKAGDRLAFRASKQEFIAAEAGIFIPDEKPVASLSAGEIGYVVTGIKQPGIASVGDTVGAAKGVLPPLPGYGVPKPVVWASVYPQSQDDFNELRQALGRLRLSDSSLSYEEEGSGVLGKGFRIGLLGMLHLEIVTERLRREFDLELVVTTPSITYQVTLKSGEKVMVYTPSKFPEHGDVVAVEEPWVALKIITPPDTISPIMQLLYEHEGVTKETELFATPAGASAEAGHARMQVSVEMPLRELMRGFFDRLKNVSSGFASLSYELLPMRPAEVARLDILVAEEPVAAFARIVALRRVEEEAVSVVEKLHAILPRQQFVTKIQAKALGRIISSKTLPALKKSLGDFGKNGGDVTRKMKLWEKQRKGKEHRAAFAKVNISQDVFLKMMRAEG
jgi:GTP-binding protein LepA